MDKTKKYYIAWGEGGKERDKTEWWREYGGTGTLTHCGRECQLL